LKNDPNRIVCVDMKNYSETVPGSLLRVCELSTAQDVWRVDLQHKNVRGLSSGGPDGTILVGGQLDGRRGWIGQYSASDGTLIRETEIPRHPIDRLVLSANGQRGATLSTWGEICIWDLANMQVPLMWQPVAYLAMAADETDSSRLVRVASMSTIFKN
jgi:hypothetical protein